MGLLDRVKASQAAEEKEGSTASAVVTAPPKHGRTAAIPAEAETPAVATAAPSPTRTGGHGHSNGHGSNGRANGSGNGNGHAAVTTAPAPAPAAAPRNSPSWISAKAQIHARLVEKYADEIDVTDLDGVRKRIAELVDEYIRVRAMPITRSERERLIESLFDDSVGLGPMEG